MYEDYRLLSQTINVMATVMAWFVKMMLYCETWLTWNGKQCCRREFLFSLHKKLIFAFSEWNQWLFCEASTYSP
jgi:hypothetical protein